MMDKANEESERVDMNEKPTQKLKRHIIIYIYAAMQANACTQQKKIHHHSGGVSSWRGNHGVFVHIHTNLSTYFHKLHQIRRIAVDSWKSCWLSCHFLVKLHRIAAYTDTLNTEKSIVSFHTLSLAYKMIYLSFALDEREPASALIKFYGIFEMHKSNSVPVHIITKTLTMTTTTTMGEMVKKTKKK